MKKKFLAGVLAMLTCFTAFTSPATAKDGNLVAGLPYTVETGVGIEYSYKLQGTESDPAAGLLTDGKYAPNTGFSNPQWHKFYRGLSRSVIFELPAEKAVTGFTVSLVHSNGAGLTLPESFDLYVSENGKDWMLAGAYDATPLQQQEGTAHRKLTAALEKRCKAKYLKVTFRLSVNLFIDEIEIYGGDLNGSEAPFVKTEEPAYPNAYNQGVEGCRDTVLLYCGYPGEYDASYVENTYEEMLYYCGYVNGEGEVTDTFFDSFQFAPLRGAAPSGGSLNESGGTQTVKSDWEYYLDSVFDDTHNCGAIERAMDTVNISTGKTDGTISMILTIPFPTIGNKAFGDIDGDGEAEYCRNREEQLAIYRWFFDQVEARLAEKEYKNIRFAGYYWEQEGLAMTEDYYSLVKAVGDEIHSRKAKFFWIPFLYGNGFDMVRELGFDSAVMQPNYAFLDYVKEEFLGELDVELRKYGLGIEVEIHWNAPTDDGYLARYYGYLNGGYALGYMNAANAYYQNSNPGTYYNMAKSQNPKLRRIYDDTYAYVKGTYTPPQVVLTSRKSEVTILPGETVSGYARVENGCYAPMLGQYQWQVTRQPSYGSAEVTSNGKFDYAPADGFTGTDTFTIQLVAPYAESEELVITVHVGDTSGEVSDPSSGDTSSHPQASEPTPANAEKVSPLWFGILAGAVAAVAAGIWFFLKRKDRT